MIRFGISRKSLLWGVSILTALALALPGSAQEPAKDEGTTKPSESPNATEGDETMPDLPPETLVMPSKDIYPQEVLSSEFVDHRTVPFDDRALEFTFTCRKTWTWHGLSVPSKEDELDFVPLAFVSGPETAEAPSIIQVGYRLCEREVDLQDYLEAYCELLGYKILKAQWCNYSGRTVYDVLVRTKARGIDSLARLALSRDGQRLFLVSGICASAGYPQLAKEIGVAVVSFELVNPSGKAYCEEMKEHKMTEPVKASFTYPGSWTLKAAAKCPAGIGVVDIRHGDAEVGAIGWIRLKVVDRATYPKVGADENVLALADEMTEQGFVFGKPLFSGAPAVQDGKFLEGGRVLIYPVSKGDIKSEVRLVVVPTKKAWFVLSLLTPQRPSGMMPWMVNKRAYEIVYETLKPE